MRLYCATTNAGKLREFQAAAERFGGGEIVVAPVEGLERIPACQESGSTFAENATQKAVYYSRYGGGYLFADDSGLELPALGGAPGIYSARFAGPAATDADNNQLVLARMAGKQDRRARFVCYVALARGGELIATFEGTVEGVLLEAGRGAGGFGYDPLFYYPPLGRTLAEVEAERKLAVSHRGKALEEMFRYLLGRASRPAGPP